MSKNRKIQKKNDLRGIAQLIRGDVTSIESKNFILIYAYNGTGKTRLSMEFKNIGKSKRKKRTNNSEEKSKNQDTLYFNAFTEDLFHWENDLENDSERYLKINSKSKFFAGLKELALEEKIAKYFHRYTNIDFKVDYEDWKINFSIVDEHLHRSSSATTPCENIKISRGEENIFIWSLFLAFCELVIDGDESYDWVKYIYIDDPISSLDENNAIMVAVDLIQLLKKGVGKVKCIISTHHALFFNVLCNETSNVKKYFLSYSKKEKKYLLCTTCDSPFFHHVAMISELKQAVDTGNLRTYHFNILRSLLEKASNFHGSSNFAECIKKGEDDPDGVVYQRMLQLLSHGGYSHFEPKEMLEENKDHFKKIFENFLEYYPFNLQFSEEPEQENQ